MKVRAAILQDVGAPFLVQDVDLQEPLAGEVLVQVKAVGVCHSDWHLVTGDTKHPLPLVAGHEGAGIVAAIGDGVSRVRVGDLVALNWAPNCGSCFYCHHGRPSLCDTYVGPIWAGTMLDGTTRLFWRDKPLFHYSALACFAENCVVPEPCCVPLPGDIPAEIAAVIGCAVMTGVGSVLNTAKVPPGSSVAVIGCGGVGLSTIMGAKLAGAGPIFAIDALESRLEAAHELGADKSYKSYRSYEELVELLRTDTGGRGPDFVFEAVGKPELQELALELVRPGGTVVLSGLSPNGSATNLPGAKLVRQEKTVMGSYYGTANTAHDFPLYAELWKQGKLPLEKLISHRYPLQEINIAYADMLEGKSRRGVIAFE
ncbi:MAG TPA: Zn-dependent alcohol dehydrogenase [Fimbriimonadaceae bacterium]|nr:Zn-dependent alcohol dehydrogenase [Fimbriimonadaceae bacterium]